MASKKAAFVIDQADEITEKAAFTWRTNMGVRCRSQTGEERSRLMGFGGGDSQASLVPHLAIVCQMMLWPIMGFPSAVP